MKASVNDDCTGCGLCAETCPEVFELGEDEMAIIIADPVPPNLEPSCREAAEDCPVDAITLAE